MRDYRDAKAMAQSLRQALTHDKLAVTHSRSLELVAQAFGLDNWNILAARIEAAQTETDLPIAVEAGPKTLHCSFCGKSQHDVRKLIAGPDALICDACVALCNDVIEHTDVLALLSADGDVSALTAYLSARSSEQLRAYLEKAEQAMDRERAAIGVAAGAIAARAGRQSAGAEPVGPTLKFLAAKTDAELEAHKAALERSLARSERVPPIVARILAERDAP